MSVYPASVINNLDSIMMFYKSFVKIINCVFYKSALLVKLSLK